MTDINNHPECEPYYQELERIDLEIEALQGELSEEKVQALKNQTQLRNQAEQQAQEETPVYRKWNFDRPDLDQKQMPQTDLFDDLLKETEQYASEEAAKQAAAQAAEEKAKQEALQEAESPEAQKAREMLEAAQEMEQILEGLENQQTTLETQLPANMSPTSYAAYQAIITAMNMGEFDAMVAAQALLEAELAGEEEASKEASKEASEKSKKKVSVDQPSPEIAQLQDLSAAEQDPMVLAKAERIRQLEKDRALVEAQLEVKKRELLEEAAETEVAQA